jgi:hypothetical protein
MSNIVIHDLDESKELDAKAMSKISGGRMKLPGRQVATGNFLATPDGEPIDVYVDGVLTNSVTTGYAPRR